MRAMVQVGSLTTRWLDSPAAMCVEFSLGATSCVVDPLSLEIRASDSAYPLQSSVLLRSLIKDPMPATMEASMLETVAKRMERSTDVELQRLMHFENDSKQHLFLRKLPNYG